MEGTAFPFARRNLTTEFLLEFLEEHHGLSTFFKLSAGKIPALCHAMTVTLT